MSVQAPGKTNEMKKRRRNPALLFEKQWMVKAERNAG
jgi:hypothetical protein